MAFTEGDFRRRGVWGRLQIPVHKPIVTDLSLCGWVLAESVGGTRLSFPFVPAYDPVIPASHLFFEAMFTNLLSQSQGLSRDNYLGTDLGENTAFQGSRPSTQGASETKM